MLGLVWRLIKIYGGKLLSLVWRFLKARLFAFIWRYVSVGLLLVLTVVFAVMVLR